MSLEIQKLTTAFDVAANRIAELRFEADGLQRSYERTAKQLQEVQADRDVWVVAMSQIAQLAGVTLSVFLDGIPDPRKAVATICDALQEQKAYAVADAHRRGAISEARVTALWLEKNQSKSVAYVLEALRQRVTELESSRQANPLPEQPEVPSE